MNLKKLHEAALWRKLNDEDFKTKAINFILEQQQTINDLIKITTDLKEEIELIKIHTRVLNSRSNKLSKSIKNIPESPQPEMRQNAIKTK